MSGLRNSISNNCGFSDVSGKYFLYIGALLLAASYYLITWPVSAGDTDLWFHLDYGRYLSETKSFSNPGYFSFIDPPLSGGFNCWLFQISVYQLYLLTDYYGLIVLRAIFYIANLTLILLFLLRGTRDRAYLPYISIIFFLYFFFLMPRYQLIRPHLIDYLFITASISIIESDKKNMKYLPLISLLWSNLHGIVFPVIILISLSYISEFFIVSIKNKKHIDSDGLRFIIPLVLSMATVLITPLGLKLFHFAATAKSDQYLYTQEFLRLNLKDILSFSLTKLQPAVHTLFNLILISAAVSLITGIVRKKIRISHILLFSGGIFLLTNGKRFMYEFVLLSLPLLKANPFAVNLPGIRKKITTPVYLFLFVILMSLPFMYIINIFSGMPKYPFSTKNLPHGNTVFLNAIDTGGTVLNHPNSGGYLRWMLYPKYRIFIDMEFPGFFTDEDFFIAANTFSKKEVLRKVLAKYDPSFITLPVSIKEFENLIKEFSDYAVVFFDDAEVLYANRKKVPDIVSKYGIADIDPYTIIGTNIETLLKEKGEQKLMEPLLKMHRVYPDSGVVNQLIAIIHNRTGSPQKAINYAERVISNFPEASAGYRLKADALKALKNNKDAVIYYKNAIERAATHEAENMYKDLGFAYIDLQDYKNAYKSFKKSINLYSMTATHIDLYYLGSSAFLAGNLDDAEKALRYAYKKVPSDDTEWRESIKKHLELLGSIPKEL